MVLCLSVRFSRKTKDLFGPTPGLQETLWLESYSADTLNDSGLLNRRNSTPPGEEPRIGRVRWYRLPGMTFVAK